MNKSQHLRSLVRVTDTLERSAARVLQRYRRMLADAETQMQQLIGYRDEYATRLRNPQADYAARQVRDFHVFLTKLNEAVVCQHQRVQQHRAEYERKRHDWYLARRRLAAAGKLAQREHVAQQRRVAGHEQRETDDRVQRRETALDD